MRGGARHGLGLSSGGATAVTAGAEILAGTRNTSSSLSSLSALKQLQCFVLSRNSKILIFFPFNYFFFLDTVSGQTSALSPSTGDRVWPSPCWSVGIWNLEIYLYIANLE